MLSVGCLQKSSVEHRIAVANSSKMQPLKLEVLECGKTQLDIRGMPDRKDERGWRGPARAPPMTVPEVTRATGFLNRSGRAGEETKRETREREK